MPQRRALLTAGLTLPLMSAVAAQAQQPHPLRQRVGTLRVGANLERWFPIAENNHSRRLGTAWWRQFNQAGFDHARLFLPNPQDTGEGQEVLTLFAQAVADATSAGLPVMLGLLDSFHHSSPWEAREWSAFEARAAFFAERTDPARVVLAPLNESAFPDAATWMPMRDRLLTTLRRHAPRHLLAWGGHEWCSLPSLIAASPPRDADCIAEVHDYQGGNTAAIASRFAAAAAWRDHHGVPVLVSELGGADANKQNRAALAEDLRQSLPALRQLRLPATLWAFTHGGWWRLQDGSAAIPHAEIRALLG